MASLSYGCGTKPAAQCETISTMLFDAHLRIFAPASPRSANQGLAPAPPTAEA